jgi:hypothetical protein
MAIYRVPEEFFSKPLEQNEIYFNELINNKKYNKQRKDMLYRFISFKDFSTKLINKITISDIINYIDLHEKYGYAPTSIINRITDIADYINFVKEKNELIFPPQIVNEINELEVYYRTKTNKKAKAFNSEQLKMIREYNKTDSKANYYFELLFQLDDIKKEDIDYCTPKYLDREKWVFIRPNGTPIRINSKIKELIKKTADQKELEISYNMGSRYLENITKNLKIRNCFYKESNLNIYDIRESSKNFFIVCPNCKNRLESDANNWVLAKTEHDDDYRLVCNVCKGEPQDEN